MRMRSTLAALLAGLPVLGGCAVNPVTQEREIAFLSRSDEVELGQREYAPLQQASGGVYGADPALADYVEAVGQRVAAASDRALPYEFVILNEDTPNAWALPGGKIGITRGLLAELENEAELAAVLGHEVVHAAAGHGARTVERGMLFEGLRIGVGIAAGDSGYGRFTDLGAQAGLALIGRAYSRDAERESDYYGMKYLHRAGYDTMAAVTLQEKFVALSEGRDPGWLEGLFATHPPSKERVAANRAALADFPPGGESGADRYRERMAALRASGDAYRQAAEARELAATDTQAALRLADSAIAAAPREAAFHGIKGDVLARAGRYRNAVAAYDAALQRDGGYYRHFLGRGQAWKALGERGPARVDLERANALLPTAAAHHDLGTIALADGDRGAARRHFAAASRDRGETGKAAREAWARLDIVDNPGNHVDTDLYFDEGNRANVVIVAANRGAYDLEGLEFRIEAEVNGRRQTRRVRLARLRAGTERRISSGWRFRPEDKVAAVVRVERARLAP